MLPCCHALLNTGLDVSNFGLFAIMDFPFVFYFSRKMLKCPVAVGESGILQIADFFFEV